MWILFAFLSAVFLGFYDVFKKLSLEKNAVLPILMLNTVFCALAFVPLIIGSFYGCWTYVPVGGIRDHCMVLVKAVIVLSSWVCGYYAMKHLPLTIVGPINATRPVMTLVGALLIYSETLNTWQWAGVLLSVLSVFLLSVSGRREGIRFERNNWVLLLFLAAILGASSGLYDKFLLASLNEGGLNLSPLFVQSWYNIYQAVMMSIVLLCIWYPTRTKGTPFKWKWSILFISIFLTLADIVYFYALSLPGVMISVVSMVRRGSVLVSFIFGALIFKEKNLRFKAFDLILIFIGMILLYIGTV